MQRGRVAAAVAAAAAIAATGCGGGGEEEATAEAEADARAATETYVQALKDGDAEAACGQLSEGALTVIRDSGDDCVARLEPGLTPQNREALASLEVVEVNASGNTATATIGGGPQEITNELVLEDGEWKLASPGGVGQEGETAD